MILNCKESLTSEVLSKRKTLKIGFHETILHAQNIQETFVCDFQIDKVKQKNVYLRLLLNRAEEAHFPPRHKSFARKCEIRYDSCCVYSNNALPECDA